jgi:hypothetical protein
MIALLVSLFLNLALVTAASAQIISSPAVAVPFVGQKTGQVNTTATSALNAAVSVTLAGVAGQQLHIYTVLGSCSAGTATFTISDGATVIFNNVDNAAFTTTGFPPYGQQLRHPALTISMGNTATVTLAACGVGNTGTLNVVADQTPPSAANPWSQQGTLFNSSSVSAVNAAVSAPALTGAAGQQVHIYNVSAKCSAGVGLLTIVDGATTIWSFTSNVNINAWPTQAFASGTDVALTLTAGNSVTVTLGACGVGNTGTLNVQADRF